MFLQIMFRLRAVMETESVSTWNRNAARVVALHLCASAKVAIMRLYADSKETPYMTMKW